MSTTQPEMTRDQNASFQSINDRWGVKSWVIDEDGVVQFVADDGDAGYITPTGEWSWLG